MAEPMPTLYLGLLGSAIAGLGTGLGAVPILFVRRITQNIQGVLLGFGAGVMLAATAFSLVLPGLEAASVSDNPFSAASIVIAGILLGGAFLWLSHQYFPHEHFFKGREGSDLANLKRVWLFVISDEIIPESNRLGYERAGTTGVMLGFVLMLFLDVTLG